MLVLLLLRSTGLAQTLDLVLYDLIISQRAEGSGQNKLRKVLILFAELQLGVETLARIGALRCIQPVGTLIHWDNMFNRSF